MIILYYIILNYIIILYYIIYCIIFYYSILYYRGHRAHHANRDGSREIHKGASPDRSCQEAVRHRKVCPEQAGMRGEVRGGQGKDQEGEVREAI